MDVIIKLDRIIVIWNLIIVGTLVWVSVNTTPTMTRLWVICLKNYKRVDYYKMFHLVVITGIPKDNILKYSKGKFYERLREILSWDIVVGEAHMTRAKHYTLYSPIN